MMRLILLLPLLSGCSSAIPDHIEKSVYAFENWINATIQTFLANLSDPVTLKYDEISITDPLLTGNLQINNLTATGLKDMKVAFLNLTMVGATLNFSFEFDSIRIKIGKYDLDVVLLDLLPIYGEGPASIDIRGLKLRGETQADLRGGFQLKNLLIQIGLNTAYFDIRGDYYNDDFSDGLNRFLNENVVNFVNGYPKLMTVIFSPLIEDLFNVIFNGSEIIKQEMLLQRIDYKNN